MLAMTLLLASSDGALDIRGVPFLDFLLALRLCGGGGSSSRLHAHVNAAELADPRADVWKDVLREPAARSFTAVSSKLSTASSSSSSVVDMLLFEFAWTVVFTQTR
jgi:hypothetical protein